MDNYELLEYNLAEFLTPNTEKEFFQRYKINDLAELKKVYTLTKKELLKKLELSLTELSGWQPIHSIEEFSIQLTEHLNKKYLDQAPLLKKYTNIVMNINDFLAKDIHAILLRTIVYDFNLLKSQHSSLLVSEYIKSYLSQEMYIINFFKKFPVLLELIENKTKKTITYIAEVVQQLEYDAHDIKQLFDIQLNSKISIEFSSGDPHLSGKFPVIIKSLNKKLIYKPRSSYNDQLFGECISLFNDNCDSIHLSQIKLLNRTTYSWSEFALSEQCHSENEVEEFYYRMGTIIAILFFLNASDIHLENLIARGSSPILIDLECLFNNLDLPDSHSVNEDIMARLTKSVLNTGILPMYNDFFKDDVSALGSHGKMFQQIPIPQLFATKDSLEIKYQKKQEDVSKTYSNLPTFNTENYRFLAYKDKVYAGFIEAFTIFLNKKEQLIKIVEKYKDDLTIRHLIKSTGVYTKISSLSYHPRFVQAPLDRLLFIFSQIVNYGYTDYTMHEIDDIIDGDVPYIFSKLHSNKVSISNRQEYHNHTHQTFFSLWKKQLLKLTEKDLAYQLNILKKSFGDQNINLEDLFKPSASKKVIDKIPLLETYIDTKKITHKNQISWFYTGYEELNTDNNFNVRLKLQPMPTTLYSGKIGVALTYYYLWKTRNSNEYQKKFLYILNDLVNHFDLSIEKHYGIGMFSGIGGYLYLFNTLEPSLKTAKIKKIEQQILTHLKETIAQDQMLDILSGTAGLLLFFCNLYKKTPKDRTKEFISLCANHLQSRMKETKNGAYWETTAEKKVILGFSHGTSGILYALSICSTIIDVPRIKEITKNVLFFENQRSKNNRWFDTRAEPWVEQNEFYCNGLVGMLINRYLCDKEAKNNIFYLQTLQEEFMKKNKDISLCHGLLGNRWLFHHFFNRYGLQEYASLLEECDKLLNKQEIDLACLSDEFLDISLMTGISGVILGLLARENPHIPNVLLLEL